MSGRRPRSALLTRSAIAAVVVVAVGIGGWAAVQARSTEPGRTSTARTSTARASTAPASTAQPSTAHPSTAPSPTVPVTSRAQAQAQAQALAQEPSSRSVLPVDGDLLGINGGTTGHVRLDLTDAHHVLLRLTDFTADGAGADGDADVRILLSAGDVTSGSGGAVWAPRGRAVDVARVDPGARTVTVSFEAERLPVDLRSAVVIDRADQRLLGGAELLPIG